MVSPSLLQIRKAKRGLYETFDFRGESADGRYAFLLRHTMFRPLWRGAGVVEVALMLFDRQGQRSQCVVEREEMSELHLRQLRKLTDWEGFAFSFASGSYVEISRHGLRGKLHTPGGAASWTLDLLRKDDVLQPFPADFCYGLPWPGHKIQVRDCALRFMGRLQAGNLRLDGEWSGSNLHYWGDGYPREFAAAQCGRFEGDSQAFFYGFSSQLSLGRLRTPYLGMASLRLRGRWYHFNELGGIFRHRLESLDNYRWRIVFLSPEYGLKVEVDGGNPRLRPWLAWHADHPLGGRSVIKATPFAQGSLTLYRRRNSEQVATLHSDSFELKTLLPENVPEATGFLAEV